MVKSLQNSILHGKNYPATQSYPVISLLNAIQFGTLLSMSHNRIASLSHLLNCYSHYYFKILKRQIASHV